MPIESKIIYFKDEAKRLRMADVDTASDLSIWTYIIMTQIAEIRLKHIQDGTDETQDLELRSKANFISTMDKYS